MFQRILIFSLVGLAFTACEKETDPNSSRSDFLGPWTCNEYEGDFAPQTYTIDVIALGSDNQVSIKGLYNQGLNFIVTGVVQGNQIFINQQLVDGITIGGSGMINENLDLVNISFSADDGSGSDQVKANWIR